MQEKTVHALKDFSVIAASVAIAVLFVSTDTVANFLISTREMQLVGSFVAGIFFTSAFTTAPAIVAMPPSLSVARSRIGTSSSPSTTRHSACGKPSRSRHARV